MTDVTKKRIGCISGAVLSASFALSGICLIAACLSIYFSGGEDPYSPASVAAAYRPIAWALWLSIGLSAVCLLLRLFLPEAAKAKPEKQLPAILAQLRATREPDEAQRSAADSLVKARKRMRLFSIVLLAAGSLVFLVYALNGSHFHDQDINGSVIRAMWRLLPCMGLPFLCAVISAYSCRVCMELEIKILQQAPKTTAPLPKEITPAKSGFGWVRWAILGVGIAIFVYGFLSGGTLDVLTKAINICTECVGLG